MSFVPTSAFLGPSSNGARFSTSTDALSLASYSSAGSSQPGSSLASSPHFSRHPSNSDSEGSFDGQSTSQGRIGVPNGLVRPRSNSEVIPKAEPDVSGDFTQTFYDPFRIKHRRRTSPPQLKILEYHFERNPKPDVNLRKALSEQLDMTPREVQVWFQNRRAKTKKIREKADKEIALAEEQAAAVAVKQAKLAGNKPVAHTRPDNALPRPSSLFTSDIQYARRGSSPAVLNALVQARTAPVAASLQGYTSFGGVQSPLAGPAPPLPSLNTTHFAVPPHTTGGLPTPVHSPTDTSSDLGGTSFSPPWQDGHAHARRYSMPATPELYTIARDPPTAMWYPSKELDPFAEASIALQDQPSATYAASNYITPPLETPLSFAAYPPVPPGDYTPYNAFATQDFPHLAAPDGNDLAPEMIYNMVSSVADASRSSVFPTTGGDHQLQSPVTYTLSYQNSLATFETFDQHGRRSSCPPHFLPSFDNLEISPAQGNASSWTQTFPPTALQDATLAALQKRHSIAAQPSASYAYTFGSANGFSSSMLPAGSAPETISQRVYAYAPTPHTANQSSRRGSTASLLGTIQEQSPPLFADNYSLLDTIANNSTSELGHPPTRKSRSQASLRAVPYPPATTRPPPGHVNYGADRRSSTSPLEVIPDAC